MRSSGLLFVDGRITGFWTRAIKSTDVAISVTSIAKIDRQTRSAIESEAEAFGRFCDRTPVLEIMHQPA
jgi:hypothetical protein